MLILLSFLRLVTLTLNVLIDQVHLQLLHHPSVLARVLRGGGGWGVNLDEAYSIKWETAGGSLEVHWYDTCIQTVLKRAGDARSIRT